MNRDDLKIEHFLPHRDRMKLIDKIITIDDKRAVTQSVVTERWPFFNGKAVNPIVLIELAAQTAGINNGRDRIEKYCNNVERMGWVVGIKKSRFFIDEIPLHTQITTCSENTFTFDNFVEALGITKIESEIVGEITLQLFQPELD